jgi:hypothetical protein
MKPIFPVNLCKLVDKLFTEFENADTIRFAVYGRTDRYLSIGIVIKEKILCNILLYEDKYMDDMRPHTTYIASKKDDKIQYNVGDKEAISGLELEKHIKKLRAIVHCCQEGGKVLLNIDDKLLKTLKVLDNVF